MECVILVTHGTCIFVDNPMKVHNGHPWDMIDTADNPMKVHNGHSWDTKELW